MHVPEMQDVRPNLFADSMRKSKSATWLQVWPNFVGAISLVQMEVGQSAVDKQFEIMCSSTSGCTPASINLHGTLRFGVKH